MKRIALIFSVLAVLLVGCDDFDQNTYAMLSSAETIHVTIHNLAIDAKRKNLITHEQAVQMADVLDLYQGTFLTLKVMFEAYITAEGPHKDSLKAQIRNGLTALAQDQKELHTAYSLILQGVEGAEEWDKLK